MSTILRVNADQRRSYTTAASPVLLAWLALVVWNLSPYAEWLDHARIEDIAAPLTIRLAVFTLGWTLMIIAMMLPGTLLLLVRCSENQPFRARHIAPVILAYLVVWTVFGSLSYLGDNMLHQIVEQVPVLAGMIAPGVLLLAGVYQLTPMKRICLSKCRPEGAVFETLGQSRGQNLWAAGLQHGVFCLGSCWALMLLMFAIGGVNLIWMAVLGVIMAGERLTREGVNLAQMLGVLLILSAVIMVFI